MLEELGIPFLGHCMDCGHSLVSKTESVICFDKQVDCQLFLSIAGGSADSRSGTNSEPVPASEDGSAPDSAPAAEAGSKSDFALDSLWDFAPAAEDGSKSDSALDSLWDFAPAAEDGSKPDSAPAAEDGSAKEPAAEDGSAKEPVAAADEPFDYYALLG